MHKTERIYVAGHTGLVGSAICRKLKSSGYEKIILRSHYELDLTRQADVEEFFRSEKPDYVIIAAAKVGGIHANLTYTAQFIYENIAIQSNIIHNSYLFGVKKLLFLGSACSYPRECPQPMIESCLLAGYLEPTNESYAIAKISGIKMCHAYNKQYGTNFICAVPTNTYGPNDNFDSEDSHVIPALIKKFHFAKELNLKEITLWGTGSPKREFIYVDDLANACLFLMDRHNGSEMINVGTGEEISIGDLAQAIKEVVAYKGELEFDISKPDGMPRKILDSSKLAGLEWKSAISLKEGIARTYDWYLKHKEEIDRRWKNQKTSN